MSEEVETHENCDCIIVHPTGQLQSIKECWCKVYHVFGKTIQREDVIERHMKEDIYCYYLKNGQKYNFPSNMYLERKLGHKIFGVGIFYRKGADISLEKSKTLLL